MQIFMKAYRIARVFKSPQILLDSAPNHKLVSSSYVLSQPPISSQSAFQWQYCNHYSSGNYLLMRQNTMYLRSTKALYCTGVESTPTEAVKELYDKILDSVNVKRTMAPNAWLWSLIEKCNNLEDIKILFDTLRNLRGFRLSNLRIHDNFNCHLCRQVTKACARVGAIDFGKKTLMKHNVYGITPTVGSANHLLLYAKEHNDVHLMDQVMKLMKKNGIPLQPSTADAVFSICYNTNNWEWISKYSKKFLKAGVQLRKTAFDMWMDFAVRRGDTESLWQIEKLRSISMQHHTLVSSFSCAKGLILESKPDDAAAVIQILNQTLPDSKKPGILFELQKLVREWPLDVVKHQPEENRKAVVAVLKSNIPSMMKSLSQGGLEANVNLESLIHEEISC